MQQQQQVELPKAVVVIVGAGNAAHVAAGFAAARENIEARVLTMFQDEAERWTNIMKTEELTVHIHIHHHEEEIKSRPALITKDPEEALRGADMIIFCVPAFAHQSYFEAIEPFIKPNTSIVGLPGQPGFEFQCIDVLKSKSHQCPMINFESLPWACRMNEFGKSATVLGMKCHLQGSLIKGSSNPSIHPKEILQRVMGPETALEVDKHFLVPILDTKSIVHPPIMYAVWRDWDGKPLDKAPPFYQGLDDKQIKYLAGISQECKATADAIAAYAKIDLSKVTLLEDCYRIDYADTVSDFTSLYTIMKTNSSYDGLVHPMLKTDDQKLVPNFGYRYLKEDVPDGIVVTKGVALLAGVETPFHNEVLMWCQEKLGKEYLVNGDLTGKDINETRCPQKYGYKTLDDLLRLK